MTTLGDKNFMPFNNISVRWVQNSLVDDKLWVIRINATMSATEGSFPMHCHMTWANKIARVVLSLNVQWEAGSLEDLQPLLLSEAQTEDLESKFTPAISAAIDEELLMEQIAAADAALEDLLVWTYQEFIMMPSRLTLDSYNNFKILTTPQRV